MYAFATSESQGINAKFAALTGNPAIHKQTNSVLRVMLGRAGAMARRTVTGCMGQLPAAGLHPQLACVQIAARQDCLSDYGAAPCSMRMASGGNSALTTLPGRSSLTATARSLLVDTLDMVGA